MPFKSFHDLPDDEVFHGATRKIIHEEKIIIVLLTLEPRMTLPLHSHPHEQVTHILDGREVVTNGMEKTEVSPGDVYSVPYGLNLEHSVVILGARISISEKISSGRVGTLVPTSTLFLRGFFRFVTRNENCGT